ncbi:hypothetical protein ACH47Z_33900 [Streptomyces sp. NPDC020192]|uniref:hypothetical protein n=1 Tax=Streptomyces sp. NPDC020192 TaxID=3365066 RepID=UPI003787D251
MATRQTFFTFLGAASLDPARWADSDRYDLTRAPSGHVGFGMGIHRCVGRHARSPGCRPTGRLSISMYPEGGAVGRTGLGALPEFFEAQA